MSAVYTKCRPMCKGQLGDRSYIVVITPRAEIALGRAGGGFPVGSGTVQHNKIVSLDFKIRKELATESQ